MARTSLENIGDGDWRKLVGAALAIGTIVSVAKKPQPTAKDMLQLVAAIGFFLK